MHYKVNDGIGLGLKDIMIQPGQSHGAEAEVNTEARITPRIKINRPFISAGADSVTEAEMAIAMAKAGGIGIIHRNMNVGRQVEEVRRVKRNQSFMVQNPITIFPESPIAEALDLMRNYGISGIPVVDQTSQAVVGMLTNRDVRFAPDDMAPVGDLMTKDNLVTVTSEPDMDTAKAMLHERRVEKLVVLDEKGRCAGLVTVKDIEAILNDTLASRDGNGQLRVGAAVSGDKEGFKRAQALADAEADVIVIDAAHGHDKDVLDTVNKIAGLQSQKIQVIAGNVVTAEGAEALISAGANAIKVGGDFPSAAAIMNVVDACGKAGVPIIADVNPLCPSDVSKAIACGADAVMLNSMLAGTDEAPGEILYEVRQTYKVTEKTNKHDVRRPSYKGRTDRFVEHLYGHLVADMRAAGAENMDNLKYSSKLVQVQPPAE